MAFASTWSMVKLSDGRSSHSDGQLVTHVVCRKQRDVFLLGVDHTSLAQEFCFRIFWGKHISQNKINVDWAKTPVLIVSRSSPNHFMLAENSFA